MKAIAKWAAVAAAAVVLAGAGERPAAAGPGDKPAGQSKPRAVIGPTKGPTFVALGGTPLRFWKLSPDGHTLAYGDRYSDKVEVWDARTAKKLAVLAGHSRDVWTAAFSPDGQKLAVGSDKQVKVWDVKAAKELYTVTEHDTWAEAVGFTADGTKLFSLDLGGKAVSSDAETGKLLRTAKGEWLNTMAGTAFVRFSPDRKTVAVLNNSPIRVLDPATLEERKSAREFGRPEDAVFTPDGKRILAGTGEDVVLYNLESGNVELVHKLHTERVWDVEMSPDGKLAVSGGKDKVMIVWDLEAKKVRAKFAGFGGAVASRFSPDGKTLVAWARKERSVRRFDVASGTELSKVGDQEPGVFTAFFCQDGKTLAVMDMDGKLALYDLAGEKK
jgi:WD40 repeat protein